MTVSDLIAQGLDAEGAEYVFGVPGEENEDLLFALEDADVQFVPVRHEQGAAFMAGVWGRLTGEAGVCLSTLGPGATNLLTGVADANLDKAPLVAITAQSGLDRYHHESHQRLDVLSMFRPVTKWNGTISAPEVAAEALRKAFKLAEAEKPGATHVVLPEDVAGLDAPDDARPMLPGRVRRSASDYKAIDQTVERLREAERPLILAGNGAIRKRASRLLRDFIAEHPMPVASTFMGKGAVDDRSDASLLAVGLGQKDYVIEAFEQADLILSVGYDIAEVAPEAWNEGRDKQIVHIDFEPAETYAQYDPVVEVVGDVSGALWELQRRLDGETLPFEEDAGWHLPVRERIMSDIESYHLTDGDALTVPGALLDVREALPDDGLLISDVGAHKMWIARNFATCCAGGVIISNGLASMGIALPGGLAASLAQPERTVVAAMGDGGFLMNAQELETAHRLGASFTVIVFNDSDYGLISWKQEENRGRSVSTRISNPDVKAFAESFGATGYRTESAGAFREALAEAVGSEGLSVIEAPVDASVNQALADKLSAYWENQD
ncbi:MAG: acetolactate synthase large subunit [Bacteroidetes bacterium QS_8_64_10]|jgi:acetolactate synthase-1/2/3 large subunit|nr:MAG: acetolactate synthase large subunit [Bacteroidetes bacterium QS_8_64_10]